MTQQEFDKILQSIMNSKKNATPLPKLTLEEIRRAVEANKELLKKL